jgi:hypothetical protein
LLILHGVVGEMPGTSALDAIDNPKRHLKHVAPLGPVPNTIIHSISIIIIILDGQEVGRMSGLQYFAG